MICDIVDFHYSDEPKDALVPEHIHPYCQMDVVLKGSMEICYQGKKMHLAAGQGTLVPPLFKHGYQVHCGAFHAVFKFYLSWQFQALLKREIYFGNFESMQLDWAHWAGQQMQMKAQFATQSQLAAATGCLVHLLEQTAEKVLTNIPMQSQQWIESLYVVLGQVTQKPNAAWTVEQLAEACHLSVGYFTKCFAKLFGQTPQQFLLEQRIRYGASLLDTEDMPIKVVAKKSGYATVHAFSRAFKRQLHVTPAVYQQGKNKL